jgi:hypothetical protein
MQPQLVSDVIESSRYAAGADVVEAGDQPLSQRATLAVALAPVLVLLALTLVIGDLIEPYLGLCGVLLSVAWLVLEMHQVQRTIARQEQEAGNSLAGLLNDR